MTGKIHNRIILLLAIILAIFLLLAFLISHTELQLGEFTLLTAGFSVLFISLAILLIRWVAVPLKQLSKALDSQSIEEVKSLLKQNNEFGRLAELMKLSIEQKQELLCKVKEHAEAQEALRKNEELYRNLIETSPDAIILFDQFGNIIVGNSMAAEFLGVESHKELVNQNCFRFIHPGEFHRIKRYLDNSPEKQVKNLECQIQRTDKTSFPAELSISVTFIKDDHPTCYLGICRDIAARKQAELEKMNLEEQFRTLHKMEAIGQLAGGIAHDFNNILGAISGYAELIKQKYSSDQRLEKYSTMILSAATRASDLTNKLLTFSRRGKLETTPFSTHSVLVDLLDLLERTIDKRIRIKRELMARKPIVCGDPAQFQTAIMNIALNARDAMAEGGDLLLRTEDIQIDENFSKQKAYSISPGPYIKITVSDSGTGMDEKTLSKIFEPFFTTKEQGKGTGLGLASVYGAIKSHNGYIEAQSELGKGSVFSIYLPVVDEKEQVIRKKSDPRLLAGKGSILVVDDEIFLSHALKEMLSWIGYTAITFNNGSDAIDYYRNHANSVDLIILDLMMPGMGGRECVKLFKEINSQVKIIISSGYALEEERQRLFREGVIDILQKPFMSTQLSQVIHNALGISSNQINA